jgi:hypothetical protein
MYKKHGILLQQDNSDKELWHEIIIIRLLFKLRHSLHLQIFLYIAALPDFIIPHLNTFLPHFCSFLFIAGWWLSSFCRWFLQCEKVRIFICIDRNILFLWLGNHWTNILNQILQVAGTKIKPYNGIVPETLGQMGSLSLFVTQSSTNVKVILNCCIHSTPPLNLFLLNRQKPNILPWNFRMFMAVCLSQKTKYLSVQCDSSLHNQLPT